MFSQLSATVRSIRHQCINPLSNKSECSALPQFYNHNTTIYQSTVLGSIRWATKKAGGSSKNTQDSAGRRLGLKISGGAHAEPGNILVRQRGTETHPGLNVSVGRDHTLHSLVSGTVHFSYLVKERKRHNRRRKYINVLTSDQTVADLQQYTEQQQLQLNQYLRDKRNGTVPKTSKQIYLESVAAAKKAEFKKQNDAAFAEYIQKIGLGEAKSAEHATAG